MGMTSRLYGYIDEAWPGAAAGGNPQKMQFLVARAREIEQHNEATLNALPAPDAWPPVSRDMFGWAPYDSHMVVYKNRPIHFAASLKEVDWNLGDWIEKFERLLRTLYWEKALVHFEGAYGDEHTFVWHPKREWVSRLCSGILEPISEWERTSTMEESDLEQRRESAP